MVHILNDYKAGNGSSSLDVGLRSAKEEQRKLEKKISEMERQSSELVSANQGFQKQV